MDKPGCKYLTNAGKVVEFPPPISSFLTHKAAQKVLDEYLGSKSHSWDEYFLKHPPKKK